MLTETHQEVSRRFLLDAREQLALGDNLQASEKGWSAAAHAVKAIAERRGWQYSSRRDLFSATSKMASEPGCWEIIQLFGLASVLPSNTHEGWVDESYISMSLDSIEKLLDILEGVAADTES